ncbi:MAG: efflux RND transporter periplasmic adaptor subunit, partial [bacterium]
VYYKSFSSNSSAETIITLEPQTFVQEVSVTGKVQASNNVDMGFEAAGRVAKVSVKVGDVVKKGDTLVSLANGDAYGTLLQRQADLATQQATYNDLQAGSRPEDIAIAESDVESAQASLDQNSQALVDKIKEAYSVADDAVRTKLDQFYTNPRSVNPQIIAFNNNYGDIYNLTTSLNSKRVKVGESLTKLGNDSSSLTVANFDTKYIQETRDSLALVRGLFDDLSMVASAVEVNSATTQAVIDGYKSAISSGRSSLNVVVAGLTMSEQNYNTSKSGLERTKQQLALKKAGSTEDQLAAARARVQSASAQVESARAVLAKTLIVAPFDGIVTKMDAKEGESTVLGTTYASMISASNYEVESYVSESDIAKVKVGQPARITLDTYGKDVIFPASVYEVDPAETVVDGVTTYKIKLSFNQKDDRIKSGMTSNITIETSNKPATFVIPQEALFLNSGEKMVTVDQGGKRINKKVETGGINASGDIEVVSGLMAGERIVVKNK